MLTKIYKKLISKFSNNLKPQSKRIDQMATKIQVMNQTLNKSSPKIFSIFMMLSTIPSFYFGYKLITLQYKSEEFVAAANAGINYINIKNLVFFACLSALNKFKFNSPTAKHTLPRVGVFGTLAPSILALISLCLPPSDNKYSVFPTFIADSSMLVVQAQVANYGIYPFWLYSCRHFIRFFDWIILGTTFFALRNLQKRVKSHPHQFIKQKSQQSVQQKTSQQDNLKIQKVQQNKLKQIQKK